MKLRDPQTTTLNGALLDDTAGTGNGSGTSITLTSTTNFPTAGTNFIQVGNRRNILHRSFWQRLLNRNHKSESEELYKSPHILDGATVTNSSDYVAWGEAASGDLVIDPGLMEYRWFWY